MNRHLIYLLVLACGMVTASCSNDDGILSPEPELQNNKEKIVITVDMPYDDSESRIMYNDDNLKLTWEDGDNLIAKGYNSPNDTLDVNFYLIGGAGTSTAEFEAEIDPQSNPADYKYRVFYGAYELHFNSQGDVPIYFTKSDSIQTQFDNASTEFLKDYLVIDSGDESISWNDLKNSNFSLKNENSIFRVDVFPENKLRNLKSINWTTNTGKEESRWVSLFYENFEPNVKNTLFMVFDPIKMNLKPGNKISFSLVGDKSYLLEAISTHGKEYQAGHRYYATLSTQENTINTWKEILPAENEILVNSRKHAILFDNGNVGVDYQKCIEGTTSWLFWNENHSSILRIGNSAFQGKEDVISVILPNSVTEIGDNAFSGCFMMLSITLPEGLQTIGEQAFKSCSAMIDFKVPLSVSSIGNEAFASSSLKNITIHDGLNPKTSGNPHKPFHNCEIDSITITTTNADIINHFLPVDHYFDNSNKPYSEIHLCLIDKMQDQLGDLKPDLSTNTWLNNQWKSITLIDEKGQPLSRNNE